MPFARDRHLASASDAYFRAVDVAAPPPVVFRWLCQLKIAPYSYDWIDNFGRTSPRSLMPGLEDLEVGQRFMEFFALVDFERDRHLTFLTKLPITIGLFGHIAVTYLVQPRGRSASRLVVKMVVRYPRGVLGWAQRLLLPWGDLVMMRKQLLTLKELAETQAHVEPKRVRAMADAGTGARAVR